MFKTLKTDSEWHNDPDCEGKIEGDNEAKEQEDDEDPQLAGHPGHLHDRCQCFVTAAAAAVLSGGQERGWTGARRPPI